MWEELPELEREQVFIDTRECHYLCSVTDGIIMCRHQILSRL